MVLPVPGLVLMEEFVTVMEILLRDRDKKKLNSSLQPLDIDQGVYLTGSLFRGRVFSQGAEPNNITVDVQFTPW